MNRRKFFSFLPIAPAALMVEGAQAEEVNLAPTDKTIKISMMASKHVPQPKNGLYSLHNKYVSDPSKQVSLSVGEDGNLWIKSNDNPWKRVATE